MNDTITIILPAWPFLIFSILFFIIICLEIRKIVFVKKITKHLCPNCGEEMKYEKGLGYSCNKCPIIEREII